MKRFITVICAEENDYEKQIDKLKTELGLRGKDEKI